MPKARYPSRMQQFRVKKKFREGHERIFGPGKFPENEPVKKLESKDKKPDERP